MAENIALKITSYFNSNNFVELEKLAQHLNDTCSSRQFEKKFDCIYDGEITVEYLRKIIDLTEQKSVIIQNAPKYFNFGGRQFMCMFRNYIFRNKKNQRYPREKLMAFVHENPSVFVPLMCRLCHVEDAKYFPLLPEDSDCSILWFIPEEYLSWEFVSLYSHENTKEFYEYLCQKYLVVLQEVLCFDVAKLTIQHFFFQHVVKI